LFPGNKKGRFFNFLPAGLAMVTDSEGFIDCQGKSSHCGAKLELGHNSGTQNAA
jgi:hypothetical protein